MSVVPSPFQSPPVEITCPSAHAPAANAPELPSSSSVVVTSPDAEPSAQDNEPGGEVVLQGDGASLPWLNVAPAPSHRSPLPSPFMSPAGAIPLPRPIEPEANHVTAAPLASGSITRSA